MEILDSARKHGVVLEDIRHALDFPMRVHYMDGYELVIGPGRDARLLEIGINRRAQVFHAMRARPKYC